MEKFSNVPVDDDTAILVSLEVKWGDIDILYQKWCLPCDNITAESIIFASDDVKNLTDAELEKEIRTSTAVKSDSSITIGRSDSDFTFVNFNFVVDGDEDDEDDEDDEGYEPELLTPDELKQTQMKARAEIGAKNQRVIDQLKKRKELRKYDL